MWPLLWKILATPLQPQFIPPFHRKLVTLILLSGFPDSLVVPMYTPGWRAQVPWEWSILPKNTTQWCGQVSYLCLFMCSPTHCRPPSLPQEGKLREEIMLVCYHFKILLWCKQSKAKYVYGKWYTLNNWAPCQEQYQQSGHWWVMRHIQDPLLAGEMLVLRKWSARIPISTRSPCENHSSYHLVGLVAKW